MQLDPRVRDAERLARLARTGLLDSPEEPAFDRLTRLATRILGVPVALVSLVDAERQFFKSQVGLSDPWAGARETPLSHSFCQHTLGSGEALVIEDARANDLVADNLAIPELGVIAYLGVPLRTDEGQGLGSFCAIDSKPRRWTDAEIEIMSDLAAAAMTEIALREDIAERERVESELRLSEARFRSAFDDAPSGMAILSPDGTIEQANPALEQMLGRGSDGLRGLALEHLLDEEERPGWRAELARLARGEARGFRHDLRFRPSDGEVAWAIASVAGISDPEQSAGERQLLAQVIDVTERRRLEDELRWFAEHDAMTGLMNRRRFAEELDLHVARGHRYQPEGALLLIDIDNFKTINDTHGHATGDDVLVAIGALLGRRARRSDFVARLGGDEFAVLTPREGSEAAGALAESLCAAAREHTGPAPVTISIGVCALAGVDPLTPTEVQRRADEALYAAKAAGRDCWR